MHCAPTSTRRSARPSRLSLIHIFSLYEVSLLVTRFVVVARDGKAGLTESHLGLFGDDEDEDDE